MGSKTKHIRNLTITPTVPDDKKDKAFITDLINRKRRFGGSTNEAFKSMIITKSKMTNEVQAERLGLTAKTEGTIERMSEDGIKQAISSKTGIAFDNVKLEEYVIENSVQNKLKTILDSGEGLGNLIYPDGYENVLEFEKMNYAQYEFNFDIFDGRCGTRIYNQHVIKWSSYFNGEPVSTVLFVVDLNEDGMFEIEASGTGYSLGKVLYMKKNDDDTYEPVDGNYETISIIIQNMIENVVTRYTDLATNQTSCIVIPSTEVPKEAYIANFLAYSIKKSGVFTFFNENEDGDYVDNDRTTKRARLFLQNFGIRADGKDGLLAQLEDDTIEHVMFSFSGAEEHFNDKIFKEIYGTQDTLNNVTISNDQFVVKYGWENDYDSYDVFATGQWARTLSFQGRQYRGLGYDNLDEEDRTMDNMFLIPYEQIKGTNISQFYKMYPEVFNIWVAVHVKIKLKWYQTSLFRYAMIVATFYVGGAGAVLVSLVTQELISNIDSPVLKGAAMLAVMAMSGGFDFSSIETGIATTSQIANIASQVYFQYEMKQIEQDFEDLDEEKKAYEAELAKFNGIYIYEPYKYIDAITGMDAMFAYLYENTYNYDKLLV